MLAARPVPASAAALPEQMWWLAGGILLGLLIGGFAVLAAHRAKPGRVEDVITHAPLPRREHAPGKAQPAPATAPVEAILAQVAATLPLEFAFEARQMMLTLINARLAYRLTLTNRSHDPLGAITIACDIISAHASRGSHDQLLFNPVAAEPDHRIAALDPGQSVVLKGNLLLPLAAILPIRRGTVHSFVPLARFCAEEHNALHGGRSTTRIFAIGEKSQHPGGRLGLFRLDQGSRIYTEIGQFEVPVPA